MNNNNNREIKFRGKIDNNWQYVTPEDDAWEQFWALADKKTVSEYTGLKDKNSKEIYKGDILGGIWKFCYISWCDKCKALQIFMDMNNGCQRCSGDIMWDELVEDDGKLEVIGNIYENPELVSI